MESREIYRQIILENIDYEILAADPQVDREQLDEITEIILDTVCTSRKSIRISSDDFPEEVVKSRFLKLTASHAPLWRRAPRRAKVEVDGKER